MLYIAPENILSLLAPFSTRLLFGSAIHPCITFDHVVRSETALLVALGKEISVLCTSGEPQVHTGIRVFPRISGML